MKTLSLRSPVARADRGFTIVEILVAMTVALFLIGGLLTIVQGTRRTVVTQNQLAQLQDNERLAMTLIADVIQSAGYYPNPLANQATTTLPQSTTLSPAGVFATAGSPTIISSPVAGAQGDTITIRYAAALNDNVFNCTGNQNTAVNPFDSWENTFSVVVNAAAGVSQLTCSVYSAINGTTTTVPLINDVKSMSISYGVNTAGSGSGSCVDTYKTTSQMAAGDWGNVCSVVVTLVFLNRAAPPGATTNTVTFTRVIAVMNTAGVNT